MIPSSSIVGLDVGVSWSPAQLTNPKPMIDVRVSKQQNKIWTDLGSTVLANNGDPVGSIQCPYTGAIYKPFNNTYRPTLMTDGVRWWMRFSGVSQYLFFNGYAWTETVGSMSIRFRPIGNLQGIIQIFNVGTVTDDWYYYLDNKRYAFNFRLDRIDDYSPKIPDGNIHTYTQISGIGVNSYKIYDDNTNVLTTNPNWAGSPTMINVGRAVSNSYMNFDLYGLILDGTAWNDTLRTNVQNYLNSLSA